MIIAKEDSVLFRSTWKVTWTRNKIHRGYPYHKEKQTTEKFQLTQAIVGGFLMWIGEMSRFEKAEFYREEAAEALYIEFFTRLARAAWVQALRPVVGRTVKIRDWKSGIEETGTIAAVSRNAILLSDGRNIVDIDWRIYKPDPGMDLYCPMCRNFSNQYWVPTIGGRCGPCVDKLMETLDFTVDL